MSLFAELKRRNVFKVAGAYLALAWVVVQATGAIVPALNLPATLVPTVVWIGIIGFPCVLIFSWAYELTPEGLKRESEIDRSQSITHVTGKRLDYVIIGMLAVAIGLFVLQYFRPPTPETPAATEVATTPATSPALQAEAPASPQPAAAIAPDDKSIAVLPFVNMSSDPEQEYFSDGLAEELLNVLANVGELKVTARTSSFAFKGKNVPVQEIAKTLGVANLLEGSVRKSGDRLRVTAQLIRAADGFHYWSRSYDKTLSDVFVIQEEIARAVVEEMKATLLGSDEEKLSDRGTTNIESYDEYLKGLKEFNAENGTAMNRAVAHFERALVLDPAFLKPWWWLWRAQGMRAVYGLIGDKEMRSLRRQALAGADTTGKTSAELEYMRGIVAWEDNSRRDNPSSRSHYEAALQLDPRHYFARRELIYMDYHGREMHERRLRLHEEEVARDPLSVAMNRALSQNYLELGRLSDASKLAEHLKNIAPQSYWGPVISAQVAQARGDFLGAYADLSEARRRDPTGILAVEMNAVLLANLGDQETANRLARYSSGDEVMNYARFAVALVDDNLPAMQDARAALAHDSSEHSLLAEVDTWLAIRAGDHGAALKVLGQRFSEGGEPFVEDYSWYLLSAWLHKQQGEVEESRRLLDKLEPFLQTGGFESAEIEFARVDWLAISDRGEEALDLLQSLVEKGYRPLLSQGYNAAGFPLALNPFLEPWRATPRFRTIADELGRRAVTIREQIAQWNREHPENAAVWQLPSDAGAAP